MRMHHLTWTLYFDGVEHSTYNTLIKKGERDPGEVIFLHQILIERTHFNNFTVFYPLSTVMSHICGLIEGSSITCGQTFQSFNRRLIDPLKTNNPAQRQVHCLLRHRARTRPPKWISATLPGNFRLLLSRSKAGKGLKLLET